jgi:hypothetical protein
MASKALDFAHVFLPFTLGLLSSLWTLSELLTNSKICPFQHMFNTVSAYKNLTENKLQN